MKFIAVVEQGQRRNIEAIAKAFRQMGIKVEKVLKRTGVITGSTDEYNLADLKISGIQAVEPDRPIKKS